jgi:hypothetical protein
VNGWASSVFLHVYSHAEPSCNMQENRNLYQAFTRRTAYYNKYDTKL